ncbi:MAG: ATP-dependent RNA helicase HrpA [Thermodesulfobacteriota bacterium]|nr:ATP-dependent RNA helicase HrpA [Thermodesulfobacteriota bacterium]
MTNHHQTLIATAERLLPGALRADRQRIRPWLGRIKRGKDRRPAKQQEKALTRTIHRLKRSAAIKEGRYENFPRLPFDPALPITEKADNIIQTIAENPVVIISGATGSGKTTQIPRFCIEAGLGQDGRVGCTQPRRIAAVSVARRIAEETGTQSQNIVGHKIRFADKTTDQTLIKVMTDGILLMETQHDAFLNEYDALVIDEAHERSLNIDFILGMLKRVLDKRSDLKVIITSATIDTEKFSKAFNEAPVIEVSGRMYPVEVIYMPPDNQSDEDDQSYVEQAVSAVDMICRRHPFGDILVFMPTAQDIRDTCDMIAGRAYSATEVLPLYASLSGEDQSRVFSRRKGRKIIVATNIAETSITIAGIKYVVDTGLARISHYSPRTRTTSLAVRPISKSSAEQRKGRCGRVENGVCIRLYSEKDFASRHVFTPPEILRANLADVILQMLHLDLGDIKEFPFVDPPMDKSIRDGYAVLYELGAINEEGKDGTHYGLTKKGRLMATIPLDPRLSCILIEAGRRGCLDAAAVITSALSIRDPRQTPIDKEQEARSAHAEFADPSSDFITLLNIWNACKAMGSSRLKRFCREHFLSFRRIREWRDIHGQITELSTTYSLKKQAPPDSRQKGADRRTRATPSHHGESGKSFYEILHKTLLHGYLSNIAEKKEGNRYNAARNKSVIIFPGSTLFNKGRPWIVAAEFVETSMLYARTAAAIEVNWLKPIAGDLCRETYLYPRWMKSRQAVVADRQTTLFGLVIEYEEAVPYGRVNPAEASDIFIRNALVQEDVKHPLPFMLHNRQLIETVTDVEDRLRRREFLVHSDDLFLFYRNRLDEGIYNMKALKSLVKKQGDDFLRMRRDDVLQREPAEDEVEQFPDSIHIRGTILPCEYRFDPQDNKDGVTVRIPAGVAPDIPPGQLDWLVPGLLPEKITALIKNLPKSHRRKLVPINRTVDIIIREMPRRRSALATALSRFIHERFSIEIPASAWNGKDLPRHLRMRVAVTDDKGEEIKASRDKTILKAVLPRPASSKALETAKHAWERDGITNWDLGDLPASLTIDGQTGDMTVFPALTDNRNSAGLTLFESREAALASHKAGVARLLRLKLAKPLKYLRRDMALPPSLSTAAIHFGGTVVLEERMIQKITDALFHLNVRTRVDFDASVNRLKTDIYEHGTRLREHVETIVNDYQTLRQHIHAHETGLPVKNGARTVMQTIRSEIAALVPEHFIVIYDLNTIAHLPRYLKAADYRASRAVADVAKEQQKAKEVQWAKVILERLVSSLSEATSAEKRKAVEDFFFMVEEYKVSVFAPELKTPYPVSRKRLQAAADRIERMA